MQDLDTHLFVYMPIIYFIYGISFLMLGITIAVEHIAINATKNRFKHFVFSPIGSLSIFGLVHGSVELMDMFSILYGGLNLPLKIIRLFLLSVSFYFLCRFGMSRNDRSTAVISSPSEEIYNKSLLRGQNIPATLFAVWVILSLSIFIHERSSDEWFIEGEVLSRYLIGLPGGILASLSLLVFRKKSTLNSHIYQIIASMGFAFYAIFAGLIVPRTEFYTASVLNYENFYSITHIPVQLFRSICAIVITIALLKYYRLSKELSTIRFKAILHIFIAVVIPASVVILFVCYMITNALLKLSYRGNEKLALLTTDLVSSFFENVEEKIRYRILFSRFAPPALEKDIFISLVRENAEINGIILNDKNSEIFRIEKAPFSSMIKYTNNVGNIRIKKFLETAAMDMSDNNLLQIRGHTNGNLFMRIPLMKGSIEVLLSLDKLYGVISNVRIERGWHALLVDDRGDIVIPRNRRQLRGKEILGHRDLNQGIYGRPIFENGIYYNAIEEKISPIGWSVIIEIPRNEIVAPVFRVFKGLLLGVLVIYLTAIVVAFIFVEKVTGPITLIARKVKLIAGGDFDQKLNLKTGDELQTLSEEIEDMAKSLMEKKRIEEQIMRAEKIAALGRLTAGIAHEINNPLGVILGHCQVMLKEMEVSNKYLEDLRIIEKHALACKRVVEDLLRFSRPYKKVNVEVDVNINIKESLALIPSHFLRERVNITLELSPSHPKIMGDPDKLHQLFLNLIINAFDAMKDGGTLTITTKMFKTDTGEIVEIIFRDTGCGIKEEDIGRVFDPFFTTKEVGRGTGLGLAVSYSIVKDHGGEIRVESTLGKGTTFYIVFPAIYGYEQ